MDMAEIGATEGCGRGAPRVQSTKTMAAKITVPGPGEFFICPNTRRASLQLKSTAGDSRRSCSLRIKRAAGSPSNAL